MSTRARTHTSLWMDTAPPPDLSPAATGDLSTGTDVDVAVIGGGIAGLTAAVLLKEAGATVAVLEAERVASGVSGFTTAKVTAGHTLIYGPLAEIFDADTAELYARSQMDALETVVALASRYAPDAQLERRDHYVYTVDDDERETIASEVDTAAGLGLRVTLEDAAPVGFPTSAAARYRDQLQFHPRRYLLPLARAIPGDGSHLWEGVRVTQIEEGLPTVIRADGRILRATDVIVATHHPFVDRGRLSATQSVPSA